MPPRPSNRTPAALAALLLLGLAGCAPKRWEPPPCPAGQTRCGGGCFDLATSLRNCGACGNVCLTHATCDAGACSSCPADRPDACLDVGVCTDLQAGNDGSCGACGLSCVGPGVAGADATCTAGICACTGAAIDCGGNPRCVNAQTDAKNCGGCGVECSGGRTCVSGACACPADKPATCGGTCTNLSTDARNCGSCGNACPLTGQICVAGACACPSTAPDMCGSRCVDLDTDEANCGACGVTCDVAGQACAAGHCACPPSAPAICGATPGTCTRTSDDAHNCGACGVTCQPGQVCSGGQCTGCASSTPNACGTQCCAGSLCCDGGGTCAAARANGLGQEFFSCDALGSWSSTSAQEAALAWNASPSQTYDQFCSGACLGWQLADRCAVWCFDGSFQGRVSLNTISIACLCPTQSSATW